jgi:transposase
MDWNTEGIYRTMFGIFWSLIYQVGMARGLVERDSRQCINAVFWIMRTGVPWRDLARDYRCWSNTHRRFIRWRDKEIRKE